MPAKGVPWKSHENILSYEEIIRIVKLITGIGIKYIKVTGGEPLLRKGAPLFLKNLKTIAGIEKVTLTTNGILLDTYLDEIEIDAINISLDTLNSERYKRITRCESADIKMVLRLINRLLERQITVKINCVLMRNVNEQEIIPLVSLAKDKNIIVRFIELMPIGSTAGLQPVPGVEVMALIQEEFGALSPFAGISGSGPAIYYCLDGFSGKIGFINAVTHDFCETCNRLRLTSEGFLNSCLFNGSGLDLRKLLRNGAGDDEIVGIIAEFVKTKPRFHNFFEYREEMSKIGG